MNLTHYMDSRTLTPYPPSLAKSISVETNIPPFLRYHLPQAILQLDKRIEGEIEVLSRKEISEIKLVKEIKINFSRVLEKIRQIAETHQLGEVENANEEIKQLEKSLVKAFKQGILTASEFKEEQQIAKEMRHILQSIDHYLDFQNKYSVIDQQLETSLFQVNDSFFSEMRGLSPSAFSGISASVESLEKMISFTVPYLKGKTPFTSDIVHQLSMDILSTASACSDWFNELSTNGSSVLVSLVNIWKGLETKENSLEKYASVEEVGTLLLTMKRALEELEQALPLLKDSVQTSLRVLASSLEKGKGFQEAERDLTLLLQEIEKAEQALPELRKDFENRIDEKEIRKAIDQNDKQMEESFDKEAVLLLLRNYQDLKTTGEGKLDAYVKLRRILNAVPKTGEKIDDTISDFCLKEEKRLCKKAEETLNFEELSRDQLIKEAKPKPSWFSKTLSALDPANWSDRMKQVGCTFLNAMQLTSQGIQLYQNIQTQRVKLLKEPVLTEQQQVQVDEGASKIERFLTDHYDSLSFSLKKDTKNPRATFNQFVKQSPEIAPFLETVFDTFSSKPSIEEIKTLANSYRSYQSYRFLHPKASLNDRFTKRNNMRKPPWW